jgi:hypothetical protein
MKCLCVWKDGPLDWCTSEAGDRQWAHSFVPVDVDEDNAELQTARDHTEGTLVGPHAVLPAVDASFLCTTDAVRARTCLRVLENTTYS